MDGGRNVNDGQLMVVLGSYWFVIGLITMAVLNDNGGQIWLFCVFAVDVPVDGVEFVLDDDSGNDRLVLAGSPRFVVNDGRVRVDANQTFEIQNALLQRTVPQRKHNVNQLLNYQQK